jgi:hypothetical protein
VLTGHSLGGAVAVLTTVRLLRSLAAEQGQVQGLSGLVDDAPLLPRVRCISFATQLSCLKGCRPHNVPRGPKHHSRVISAFCQSSCQASISYIYGNCLNFVKVPSKNFPTLRMGSMMGCLYVWGVR